MSVMKNLSREEYILPWGRPFDVFNFTNMLNKDWGRRYYTPSNQFNLLNHEGFEANGTTAQYTFEEVNGDFFEIDDSGLNSSRWQAQIGIRYIF